MNKRGFTLMELLVYMAIVGIVVVIAGQVYSDSTKMRIRTQGMIRANETVENVGSLIRDDLGQMGAKSSWVDRAMSSDSFYVAQETFMDPVNGDYSSFFLKKNGSADARKDSLAFRYMRYDTEGKYKGVHQISWYVEDGILWRVCKPLATDGTDDEACPADAVPVEVTDGVETFEIVPATPGVLDGAENTVLFPPGSANEFRFVSRYDGSKYFRATIVPSEGGETVTVRGFVSNYDFDQEEVTVEKKVNEFFAAGKNGTDDEWENLCTQMTFVPGTNYEISFKMLNLSERDRAQMFVAGKDHLAVGFRNLDGSSTPIRDFVFYPPMADEANDVLRVMNFSVRDSVKNVCLAFNVAAYSPLLSMGSLNFTSLKVQKSMDANYTFDSDYEPQVVDKKNVKAFRMKLKVKKNNEFGSVSLVIPVPSNGVGNH